MQELFEKLLALVLILLLGALSQRRLKLPESFYQGANDLVIRVTLPAMILCSMDKEFSREALRTSIQLLLIAVCAFTAVIIGLELWRRFSKRPPKELGLYQYLILVGNTAFMGYPVIQAVYGNDGVFYASVFNLVHNVVTFSYGVALFQRDTPIQWRKLLGNACLLSTLAGIALFLSPLRLPGSFHQALDWVGDITIPLCLLSVGACMAKQSWRNLFQPGAVVWLSLVRTALFPLLLVPALYAAGCSGVTLTVPAVLFATPVALTARAFAGRYGADADLAGRAMVVSNLISIVTLPLLAAILALL
ncbi:AEC family transporter [Oscillibacter sp.]|uniref:AEC family transporter n=1 Tax=Oscillibacter sp. TaxID=1945593 RepID=UPI002D800111|nr:AEC family transporter [Oscillibacter sp.]